MRPRVMLVTSGGLTGSLSHYAYTLSVALQDEFDFSVLCDGSYFPDVESYRRAFEADTGRALRVPSVGTMIGVVRRGRRERRRHDLVHILSQRYFLLAHDPRKDLLTVADIFPYGLKEVDAACWTEEHRGWTNRVRNASLRLTLRRAVRRGLSAHVYSRYTRDQLVKVFAYPESHLDCVPYLLDPRFRPVPRDEARRRLGLALDARVVLAVGAGIARKNLGAFYHLVNTTPAPTTFLKVGELDLARIAPERRPWVRAVPTLTTGELADHYCAADLLFFPSFAEGYGVPLHEAMVCGLPIVASSTTSIPEVAGGAALYADPHDHVALVGHVEKVLTDPEVRRRLVEQGRLRVAELDPSKLTAALRETYRRVLARSAPPVPTAPAPASGR